MTITYFRRIYIYAHSLFWKLDGPEPGYWITYDAEKQSLVTHTRIKHTLEDTGTFIYTKDYEDLLHCIPL